MKSFSLAALAVAIACLTPITAAADILTASLDSWLRDDGATVSGRDDDLISVWSFYDGPGRTQASGAAARWGILQFDLSSLAGTTIETMHLGLWSETFGGSDDYTNHVQTAAIITPTGDFTAYDWAALAALEQTPLETLGAYDLGPVSTNPQLNGRYLFTPGSTTDVSLVQSIINGGGTLSIVLLAPEGEDYRKSWGDGAYAGLAPVLYVNELPPEQVDLTLEVDTVSGAMKIVNPGVTTTFDIDGYVIASNSGSLLPENWTSLAGNSAHAGWEEVAPTANALSELNLTTSTELLGGVSLELGNIFAAGGTEDIVFAYNAAGAGPAYGVVKYVSPSSDLDGDFNSDGVVDGADFLLWQRGAEPSPADLALWRSNFGETASSSGVVTASVPEPASLGMACLGVCFSASLRRRWK